MRSLEDYDYIGMPASWVSSSGRERDNDNDVLPRPFRWGNGLARPPRHEDEVLAIYHKAYEEQVGMD